MPARNVMATKLHRISLTSFDGSTDWFDIADELAYPDRIRTADAVYQVIDGEGGDPARAVIATHHAKMMQLRLALRGWSFTRTVHAADGSEVEEPWPFPDGENARREALNLLGGTLGQWMAEQVDQHYIVRAVSRLPAAATPALNGKRETATAKA